MALRTWTCTSGQGRNFQRVEGGQVAQEGPLHQPMGSTWATLRSRSIRLRDARGTAAPGTTRRTTAWSAGPATSSRIDTTSWSGCAPTESVTPILTRSNGSIASASPTMATILVMVAARKPAHFPAEASSLQEANETQEVNETRSTPKEEEEARGPSVEEAGAGRREAAAEGGGERSGIGSHGDRVELRASQMVVAVGVPEISAAAAGSRDVAVIQTSHHLDRPILLRALVSALQRPDSAPQSPSRSAIAASVTTRSRSNRASGRTSRRRTPTCALRSRVCTTGRAADPTDC